MISEHLAETTKTVQLCCDRITRIAAGLVLGSVLLSSCVPPPAPSGFQALTDTMPPCWHMICPSETTIPRVEEILASVPGIGGIKTFFPTEERPGVPYTTWLSAPAPGKVNVSGSCYYRDGTVIYCDMSTAGLKLKHVIERYGDPEAVAFVEKWGDGRMLTDYILYPQRGLVVVYADLHWSSAESIKLKSTTRIDALIIYDPNSYEELTGGPEFYMFGPFYDEIKRTQRPWQGYGVYEYDAP